MSEKKTKKTRVGIVISDKMTSSIVVKSERLVPHKLYGKFIKQNVKYIADDPGNNCNIGDRVLIEECRPLSKLKRWRLREIIEKVS